MTGDLQLDELLTQLIRAQQRLHRLTDALSPAAWAARPGAEAWSAAECVDHLNLTSRAFIGPLRDAIVRSPPKDTGRYRMDWSGWLVSLMAGPMVRAGRWRVGRVNTTDAFVPAAAPPLGATIADFDALQEQFKSIVDHAAGKAIDKVRITSPFEARVSYSAYSALVIIPRHQTRHLDLA
jgi:hypothetical protein